MITRKDYENKRLRINLPIGNHRPGDVVNIRCDENGIPLNRNWRNKLKDAKTDGCVEVVTFTSTKPNTKKED